VAHGIPASAVANSETVHHPSPHGDLVGRSLFFGACVRYHPGAERHARDQPRESRGSGRMSWHAWCTWGQRTNTV